MRRVVIGRDADGAATMLADSDVAPVETSALPGVEVFRVWERDEPAKLPVTEAPESFGGTFFPDVGGLRFGFLTIPSGIDYEIPPGTPPEALEAASTELEQKLPGFAASVDPERPGYHSSRTVDFIVVVSGSALLRGDNGIETRLSAGDCVVQNGTPHAWFNDTGTPCVLAYSLLGAS